MSAVAELRDGPLDHFCAYLGGLVLPVLANDAPLQTSTTFVTSECFNAFGIAPILGRGLTEADAPIMGAGAHVAVISHRLWTTTYNSDPSVLGQSMLVNNVPVTIVGVLPKGFIGLEIDTGVDIFTPFDAVIACRARSPPTGQLSARPAATRRHHRSRHRGDRSAMARGAGSGAAGQHGADRADAVDGFEAAPDVARHRASRASANAIRNP